MSIQHENNFNFQNTWHPNFRPFVTGVWQCYGLNLVYFLNNRFLNDSLLFFRMGSATILNEVQRGMFPRENLFYSILFFLVHNYTWGTFLTKFHLDENFCTLLPVIHVLRLNYHGFPLFIALYFICVRCDPYLRLFPRRNKDYSHSFTHMVGQTYQSDALWPFRRMGFQLPGKQEGVVWFPFYFWQLHALIRHTTWDISGQGRSNKGTLINISSSTYFYFRNLLMSYLLYTKIRRHLLFT